MFFQRVAAMPRYFVGTQDAVTVQELNSRYKLDHGINDSINDYHSYL